MPRFIRVIEKPSQWQALQASCGGSTELGLNEQIELWHTGEDGPTLFAETLREFSLQAQCESLNGFQTWALHEMYDTFD